MPALFAQKNLVFINVSTSLQNVRYEMWFDGENERCNVEFT
jgi:hypothetical protein